ncbi:MAG: outer membrane lipoprotein-sorting protein [Bacteroidetes bacterium]|nr:MAG: outer membrane lipoprotein-sorting protein [Bacteroidota bacterium]
MKKLNVIISAALLALAISTTNGLKAQPNGQKIMEDAYHLPKGEDMQGELTMTLVNRQGEQRVRNLRQYSKDYGDVEKKIMFFLSPADVRGTSFMSWSYTDGRDDDQWIYLPALRRVRRISSDGKGDYFMGSDFTYDDLGDRHPDEDNHRLVREENLNGKACYVVESTPKDTDYMYSKTITWVMKDSNLGLKREFYDDRGRLLKILQIKQFEKIDGYWTILETEMKNVQNNHTTHMKFSNVQYNQGIPDRKFTERSMTLGE